MRSLNTQSATAYRLAGLRIVSELPLPGVVLCRDEISTSDGVSIRRGHVPECLLSVDVTFSNGQCNANELLLNIPDVARYLLSGGKEILIDQALASNNAEVCAYLLGTVFGVLCHQRGITPLHASAIDVAGGCVAFVGEVGAGKSTLVAALSRLGHQVIADDVCFLQPDHQGVVQAWPGINRIRLWEDAMVALGLEGPGVEREVSGWKYLIPIRPPRNQTQPRRLRRVYQLHAAPDESAASVRRIEGAAAIEVLIQNVYRLGLAEYMGYKPAAFLVCAAAGRNIEVFRFSRRKKLDALREDVELLEEHMRDV
jgi:energy-coupling factor transporter ATP-binding protein EcfA2